MKSPFTKIVDNEHERMLEEEAKRLACKEKKLSKAVATVTAMFAGMLAKLNDDFYARGEINELASAGAWMNAIEVADAYDLGRITLRLKTGGKNTLKLEKFIDKNRHLFNDDEVPHIHYPCAVFTLAREQNGTEEYFFSGVIGGPVDDRFRFENIIGLGVSCDLRNKEVLVGLKRKIKEITEK